MLLLLLLFLRWCCFVGASVRAKGDVDWLLLLLLWLQVAVVLVVSAGWLLPNKNKK